MKLSKFLSITTFITLLSLFYVWQQTEVFRLAYEGRKSKITFQDLLDKNTILRYNLKKNASLIHLAAKVSKVAEYEMPDTYRLVRLTLPENLRVTRYVPKKENIISRLFGIKRQAEAKTVNP